jgi:hypothetical protein
MLKLKDLKEASKIKHTKNSGKFGKVLFSPMHRSGGEYWLPAFVNKHLLVKIGRQMVRDEIIERVAKRQKRCSVCKLPIFSKEIHSVKNETLQRVRQLYFNGAFLLGERPVCCKCSIIRLQEAKEREANTLKYIKKEIKRYSTLVKKYNYETREIVGKL